MKLEQQDLRHALLMGMGGSSLAPEVFRLTFGVKEGYLDLAVLDSTHPASCNGIMQRNLILQQHCTLFPQNPAVRSKLFHL